jgi:hypothetical protein
VREHSREWSRREEQGKIDWLFEKDIQTILSKLRLALDEERRYALMLDLSPPPASTSQLHEC